MNIYLPQHADAMSKDEDPDRPLNEIGRQNALALAEGTSRFGMEVYQIRHSGKTRAEQTAKILADRLKPHNGVMASEGLGPLDDVESAASKIYSADQPFMVVGYMPFMARLTGRLAAGDPELSEVDFQNGNVVCLRQKEANWQAAWILTPQIARS